MSILWCLQTNPQGASARVVCENTNNGMNLIETLLRKVSGLGNPVQHCAKGGSGSTNQERSSKHRFDYEKIKNTHSTYLSFIFRIM